MIFLKTLIFLCILVFAQLQNINFLTSTVYVNPVPGPSIPILDEADLPQNWSWNNINGTNYLTVIKNQHIPQYCGGCWAFAATSALSDRIKIMRKAQWPDILLSPQVLLSCANLTNGCNGGSSFYGYNYIYQNYITDESCSVYQGQGFENGLGCSANIQCQTCDSNGTCYVPSSYPIYGIKYYNMFSGELNMMNEIYARGPISCGMAWTSAFASYTGGIFVDTTNATSLDHFISIVGFGIENGTKYWIVRNSWGSYWGENGFFRIIRGINNMGIENSCSWAVPLDTWTNNTRNFTRPTGVNSSTSSRSTSTTSTSNSNLALANESLDTGFLLNTPTSTSTTTTTTTTSTPPTNMGGCRRDPLQPISNNFIGSQPWEYLSPQNIPITWDWRNVSGVNYVIPARNQATPQFCGSCWAFAVTSLLADRISIMYGAKFPVVMLSPQVLLNCYGGGNCGGGNPLEAYVFINKYGLPEDSCQSYQANNGLGTCLAIEVCKTCWGPSAATGQSGQNNCGAMLSYPKWNVTQYGQISGVSQMKAEIYARGPIGCGIESTINFEAYNGGIYSESIATPILNHEVSVIGWGYNATTQTEYWIGKNSWGTFWGNQGFFNIQMYTNNLGIETNCHFGVPAKIN